MEDSISVNITPTKLAIVIPDDVFYPRIPMKPFIDGSRVDSTIVSKRSSKKDKPVEVSLTTLPLTTKRISKTNIHPQLIQNEDGSIPIAPKWNVADEYQHLTPAEISALYEAKSDTTAVACINLGSDANIGLIIRTSAIYNVGKLYVLGRRKYDKRSTVGTEHHIPVERCFTMTGANAEQLDIAETIDRLIEFQKTYTIIFIEQMPGSYPVTAIKSIPMSKPPMFVFGSESYGIPEDILALPESFCVTIPQFGIGRSLNVSIACGIVLYEWNRSIVTNPNII
jgi:tRNA G18 (ribose-2'-O)-methylase SpoU